MNTVTRPGKRYTLVTAMGLSILAGTLAAAQEAAGPAAVPLSPKPALPFAAGERLEFEIHWRPPAWLFFIPPMDAGSVTMEVKGAGNLSPGSGIHVVGEAISSGTFSSLAGIKVQNRYESLMDAESLCSRQFLFQRREGKRQQDVQIDYQLEGGRLQIRKWDAARNPPAETRNETLSDIPPCVQDVLSIFYSVRRMPLEPGHSLPVFLSNDDAKTQRIELNVEQEEKVETGLGPFQTYRILTVGLFRGGGDFRVWVDKVRKIPVKFEAKVRLGKVSGEIRQYDSGAAKATPSQGRGE